MKPRLLDLFCGAGGCATGYHQAGFDVVGVDLKYQPNFPFEFHQHDALDYLRNHGSSFDAIHASPPCQHHSSMKSMHNAKTHVDLIPETRRLLRGIDRPYVIENVIGAPMEFPSLLCGTMFGLGVEGAELRRHRVFESDSLMLCPKCRHSKNSVIGVYGEGVRDSRRKSDKTIPDFGVEQGRIAMGIDWMTLVELCQAIPPAYTQYLGKQLLNRVMKGRTQ